MDVEKTVDGGKVVPIDITTGAGTKLRVSVEIGTSMVVVRVGPAIPTISRREFAGTVVVVIRVVAAKVVVAVTVEMLPATVVVQGAAVEVTVTDCGAPVTIDVVVSS